MSVELFVELIKPIIPILLLLVGGQFFVDKYYLKRRKKELEMELIKTSKEEKYLVIHQLYDLFGEFMRLYRKINSPLTNLENLEEKKEIFNEIIKVESQVDAIILKIGCEFVDEGDNKEEIEEMLGNLRQSVQIWREKLINGEKLPFGRSFQEDYLRFKTAFSFVSAFMVNKVNSHFETPKVKMKRVESILIGAFDNKYEIWNLKNLENIKDFKKYYQTLKDKT